MTAPVTAREHSRTRRRSRPGNRSRRASLLGGAGTLVLRRAWRDRTLVLAQVALVAAATALSVMAPHIILGTVNDGLRNALTTSTIPTTTQIQVTLGGIQGEDLPGKLSVSDAAHTANIGERLPAELMNVVRPLGTSVTTPELSVTQARVKDAPEPALVLWHGPRVLTLAAPVGGAQAGTGDDADAAPASTGTLDDVLPGKLRLVDGRAPVDPAGAPNSETGREASDLPPIEVVLDASVATELGLEVGTAFRIAAAGARVAELMVVGTVAAVDATDPVWALFPETLTPYINDQRDLGGQWYARAGALTTLANVERLNLRMEVPFTSTTLLDADTDSVTLSDAQDGAAALRALRADPTTLMPDVPNLVTVKTDYVEILEAYPARAKVALAQISVLLAGVIGVAAAAIGLMAHLLDRRRAPGLALERARGASLPSVSVRLIGEQLVLTTIGVGAGIALALAGGAKLAGTELLLGTVAVVALFAAPLLGLLTARASWRSTRAPANRTDRAKITRRRTTRRWVLRLAVVALAAAAVTSLRSRGLLGSSATGVDPFLAGATVLLAVAAAVIVSVIVPAPLRLVARLGRRSRGVVGSLAAATVGRSVRLLPLTALTLGIATAVSGLLVSDTIEQGQVDASWQRVGAEVRIDADLTPEQLAALTGAPGVSSAGVGAMRPFTTITLATHAEDVTLVALDKGAIDALVAAQPDAAGALDQLGTPGAGTESDPLRLVLDPNAAHMLRTDGALATTGMVHLDPVIIHVAPQQASGPRLSLAGWVTGPVAYVDRAAFEAALGAPLTSTHAWASGDGARAAAEQLGLADDAVLSRGEWLEQKAESPLVGGVLLTIQIAVAAVAVLTLVALLCTVLAGARDRGRVLSTLRTLGLPARFGWQLALLELIPLVLAALLAGVSAALVSVLWLGPVLGLEVLTDGLAPPDLIVSFDAAAGISAGLVVLLVLAVFTEVLAHRRDRLSDVLRVGDAA